MTEKSTVNDNPLRGKALMAAVVNQILTEPETWDQGMWHCGSAHCVAGWAQIKSGCDANAETCFYNAREALGLSDEDAGWLFDGSRLLPEIHAYATAFLKGESYFDRDGYDRGGYSRYGYDRDGYDRDGYDRDGYDRGGYSRYGYDRDGYDRGGYSRYGYDRYGYDRDGYDRYGYDRDGYDRGGYDRGGVKLPLLVVE